MLIIGTGLSMVGCLFISSKDTRIADDEDNEESVAILT